MTSAVDLPLDLSALSFSVGGETLVQRTVHSSGVRILTESMPGVRSATLGFWVPVGSRDEQAHHAAAAGSLGSTHFLEHLLFKGTHSRSALDIAISFDAVGGEHNAMTAKEFTCYYAKVRDSDLSMATGVIADMVTGSVIDSAEFDTERTVILEELAMAEDDPADVASERLCGAVLGDHPLGRPIGGDSSTITGATREGVWQHYREQYQPSNLVVAAAGAVDHDTLVSEVVEALEHASRHWPEWSMSRVATPAARRDQTPAAITRGADYIEVERPGGQINLMLGVPGLIAGDPLRFAMSILNIVVGGGMSSRLFQEIREKRGLAYSTYSFASAYSDAGLFGLYAGCSPEKAGVVATVLRDEFSRLAQDGITDDELRRALGQLAGSSALALEDSETRMGRLARSDLGTGVFYDLDHTLECVAAVTSAEVQSLAQELASRPLSAVVVGDLNASSAGRNVRRALEDAL
ncbi:pitrilysin family protein [Klugiella xanthotipulae]|uniref:Putative Zn-dependent peptidase n=1 Tax=Klugiella xanthotipulae TaxID=244735 RepID=A0A543HY13_9MICO|nr:pitrilysin family protein [Klugiella xanthotipulae]TQM63160.1 putative Zn-dependent peptidase [Klugiella xanthotipulae]